MLVGTLAVTLLFAVGGGWARRSAPLYTTTMPAALVLFILWATLQQVLFQFYLLGRLRRPSPPPRRRRWRPSTGSSSAPIHPLHTA